MVVFMATGEKKAITLAEVLSGRYNPERYPAQRIDPKDGKLDLAGGRGCGRQLPRELVRRFCEG
jgi:hypothetical protein